MSGRISVDEAHRPEFKFYRLVPPRDSEYAREGSQAGDPVMVEEPRVPPPDHVIKGEDLVTPRVPLAPSIWHAIAGLGGHMTPDDLRDDNWNLEDAAGRCHEWHIYGARSDVGVLSGSKIEALVPDAKYTGEAWGTQAVELELIGQLGGDFGPDGDYYVWVYGDKPHLWER